MKTLSYLMCSSVLLLASCSRGSHAGDEDKVICPTDYIFPERVETPRYDIALTPAEQALCRANNAFGLNFFRQIAGAGTDENVLTSPLSASYALGMTTNGAGGDTRAEMLTTLGFGDYSTEVMNSFFQKLSKDLPAVDGTTFVSLANSIWVDDELTVKDNFIAVNKDNYSAEVQVKDLQTIETFNAINAWVKGKTYGMIPDILDEVPGELARMFLINALYFNGQWAECFEEELTKDTNFSNANGNKVKVKMMHDPYATINYFADDDVQMAELPYGNEAYSMLIVLPKDDPSLTKTIDQMTAERWESLVGGLKTSILNVELPRFTVDYERELNKDLQNMGMKLAFNADFADFRQMAEQKLFISKVKQKTRIEVNENGSEAAAATVVEMDLTSAGPGSEATAIDFKVNRPFIYAIRENSTGTLLFVGKIVKL